jgi:hypothetical protein
VGFVLSLANNRDSGVPSRQLDARSILQGFQCNVLTTSRLHRQESRRTYQRNIAASLEDVDYKVSLRLPIHRCGLTRWTQTDDAKTTVKQGRFDSRKTITSHSGMHGRYVYSASSLSEA